MTLKEYQKVRMAFVVLTAIIFSQAVYYKNYFIPITLLLVASLIHLWLRRRVKEVMIDERDRALAGRSALLAIQVYAWLAVLPMFYFYALRDTNPAYEAIGTTLAFSTLILLLVHALVFRYYERVIFSDKKLLYTFLIAFVFVFLFIVSIRALSGEDDWICQNGQWVMHGHPSFPAPTVPCK
jgi:uncharacterized membrane protein